MAPSSRSILGGLLLGLTALGAIGLGMTFYQANFGLGPTTTLTGSSAVAYFPAHEGSDIVYAHGCPKNEPNAKVAAGKVLFCASETVATRHDGRTKSIPTKDAPGLLEAVRKHGSSLMFEGTYAFSGGILDIASASKRNAPWPQDFEPTARAGHRVWGAKEGAIIGYSLEREAVIATVQTRCAPEWNMVLRATQDELVLGWCHQGNAVARYSLADQNVTSRSSSTPMSTPQGRLAAAADAENLFTVTARDDGPHLVIEGALQGDIALGIPTDSSILALETEGQRWVVTFAQRKGEAFGTHGFVYGNGGQVEGRKTYDASSRLVTTRAMPRGDALVYDEAGSVHRSHPGAELVPPVILVAVMGSSLLAYLALRAASLRRSPTAIEGTGPKCVQCGRRRPEGYTFCAACGWRPPATHGPPMGQPPKSHV